MRVNEALAAINGVSVDAHLGRTIGEVVPQMWTYERTIFGGQPYRAFVWMQGHNYSNFAQPQMQTILLRGIAWAGKRPVDTLMTERPQRGGRGTAPAAEGRGRGHD